MHGEKVAEMSESAGVVEKSKKAQSARNAGRVTRNEPMPEELLEILVDLLRKIENSGIEVELVPSVIRHGKSGVGFLVMGVQIIEKKMKRIQEPEKS